MTAPSTATPKAPADVSDPAAAPAATVKPKLSLASAKRRAPQGQTVPSPCSGVCKMDPDHGWCKGCYRTLEELTQWSRATDATKLAIWAQLEQRQTAVG